MARRPARPNSDQMAFNFDDWFAAHSAPSIPPFIAAAVSPRFALAQRLADLIAAGEDISPRRLNTEATDVFGGTLTDGVWLSKDAYDALEVAVSLHLRRTRSADWPLLTASQVAEEASVLTALVQRLPTQTRRDQEQDEFQQFSTPPALSFVANWVAGVGPDDVMLEPSAGTGDLAFWGQIAGADLVLNELAERRHEVLSALFPDAALYRENAEQIHNILPRGIVPTVCVMNPPFSSTAGRVQGQRKTSNGARHLEQALERLADRGRLVAIVGEGMRYDRPAFRGWWREIETRYTVRAVIAISGAEYRKYGTTFDNAILVIDKTGPTVAPVLTGHVDSVADLPALLESIRHDRPRIQPVQPPQQPQPAQPQPAISRDLGGESSSVEPGERAGERGSDSVRPGVLGAGDADDRGARVVAGEAPSASPGDDAPTDANRPRGAVRDRPGQQPDPGSRATPRGDFSLPECPFTQAEPIAISVVSGFGDDAQLAEFTESVFTTYRPQRLFIAGAHDHPGKLVQSAAMGAVAPPIPAYQPYIPRPALERGLLSLAQLEAVLYAGQAHQEVLPNGQRKGFFIGDGTGVGKGREISGILLDNLMQGRDKAVWVSCSEGLIEDARRDYSGVGGDSDMVFWQGKTPPAQDIQRQRGILFTTYSTLRGGQKRQVTDSEGEGGKSPQSRMALS